jgi:exopolyphosphatase/guanosine-5'-triphosphate,3'-diphosphate pyrophosphatase
MLDRARLIGAAFRVAFMISAAQRGVLPHTHFRNQARKLILVFDKRAADLTADRVTNRFKQLARLMGRTGSILKP